MPFRASVELSADRVLEIYADARALENLRDKWDREWPGGDGKLRYVSDGPPSWRRPFTLIRNGPESKDAETALRMLEGISLVAQKPEADEGPAVPWREALGDVLAKNGGEVATMVRACREAKNMTQQALADEVGLHKSNISEIERGKRSVGKALARKLATVLETDYRMFL